MPLHQEPCRWPQESCSCPPIRPEIPGPERSDLTLEQTIMLMTLDGYEVQFVPLERPHGLIVHARKLWGAYTVYCDRVVLRADLVAFHAGGLLLELRTAWQSIARKRDNRNHGKASSAGTVSVNSSLRQTDRR